MTSKSFQTHLPIYLLSRPLQKLQTIRLSFLLTDFSSVCLRVRVRVRVRVCVRVRVRVRVCVCV